MTTTSSSGPDSDPVVEDRPLRIWGRTLKVPLSTSNVAKFTFNELCGHPLSSADYLEITKTFDTIFLEEVPRMGMNEKDMVSKQIFRRESVVNLREENIGSTLYHVHRW